MNSQVNLLGWPVFLFRKLPVIKILKNQKLTIETAVFEKQYFFYLIQMALDRKLKMSTVQLCFSIASKFKKKNPSIQKQNQIILLTSLYIASKVMQGQKDVLIMSQIHFISNHCFTNKDIFKTEARILSSLKFKLPIHTCDQQIKLILSMVGNFIKDSYQILQKIAKDFQIIIYYYMFTKKNSFLKHQKLLPLSIVHLSLIIGTQYSGRLPPTLWIMKILQINEFQFYKFIEDLMKLIMDKEQLQQISL